MSLLTIEEAAERMRCSRRQVFNRIADGTLVKGPRHGRCTVVTAESVARACEPEFAPPPAQRRRRRAVKTSVEALTALMR